MKFIDLELLFVERVFVDVFGLGSWKLVIEFLLRNEFVEVDFCILIVFEVDVFSLKFVC